MRAADLRDGLRGSRDRFTPPRRLADYVGEGDFQATGAEFLTLFEQLAGLSAEDRVLDIGCGIGRMARVLVPVLRPPGSYDGFDIVSAGVEWCVSRYQDTPASFRFKHADVRNALYNPNGTFSAVEYRFPYESGGFDLVLATSVFTHLLPDAAEHFLAEAARMLAPGGRAFLTWFLLDDVTSQDRFSPGVGLAPAWVAEPAAPEAAVAFPENWLRERMSAHGLQFVALHPGCWRGNGGATWQDVVIARREEGRGRDEPTARHPQR